MRKYLFITLAILALVVLAGCASQAPPAPEPSAPQESSNVPPSTALPVQTASIQDFTFIPGTLTVKVGQSVKWVNKDSVQHTVTSDSGSELGSPYLSRGESYTHTFNTPGEYAYHCAPHPNMKGKVIVK